MINQSVSGIHWTFGAEFVYKLINICVRGPVSNKIWSSIFIRNNFHSTSLISYLTSCAWVITLCCFNINIHKCIGFLLKFFVLRFLPLQFLW